jgi:DNA-binding CsgD family transcriptional regulator
MLAGVAELPRGAVEIAVEIGRIASAPGSIEERAHALLDPLRRLIPFRAACLELIDLSCREQLTLVSEGYDEATLEYIESPASIDEIAMLGFHRNRAPMCLADLPVPAEQVHGWVEYLKPAGFKEGLGVGLFTADGRFIGTFGASTDDPDHPTAAARDFIGRLAPTIASAVDPQRSIGEAARIVRDATAGIILTTVLDTLPLPGLPGHRVLHDDSDVLALVHRWHTAGRVHGSFLCPADDAQVPDNRLRVTLLSCPSPAPHYPIAAVLVSAPGNTCGLTARELDVLGLLVEGWPNQRIASALFITVRTVASHVEHILAKLAAPSRTFAAVRALRQGLYVPRPLNGVPLG